ncbi:hypothetical protein [Roseburia inulinivorans]
MKLIDADALKEYCMRASKSDDDFRRVSLATLASVIDAQPTAYNVDKVVEQLEEVEKIMTSPVNRDCFGEECRASDCTVCLISKAIEIVKGGGVE